MWYSQTISSEKLVQLTLYPIFTSTFNLTQASFSPDWCTPLTRVQLQTWGQMSQWSACKYECESMRTCFCITSSFCTWSCENPLSQAVLLKDSGRDYSTTYWLLVIPGLLVLIILTRSYSKRLPDISRLASSTCIPTGHTLPRQTNSMPHIY